MSPKPWGVTGASSQRLPGRGHAFAASEAPITEGSRTRQRFGRERQDSPESPPGELGALACLPTADGPSGPDSIRVATRAATRMRPYPLHAPPKHATLKLRAAHLPA